MGQQTCSIIIQGTKREYPKDTTFQQIADEYQKAYTDDIVLVKFQHDLRELSQSVLRDGELEFITTAQKPGKDTYRRSVTLLMEAAAWKLYPNLELLVQHSIGQGYYCEFRYHGSISVPDQKMLQALKEKMLSFVAADLPIVKYNMNTQDASARFKEMGRMDKVRLMRYRRSSRVNVYELQGFPDYYYGYMVPSTGYLNYFELISYQNGFMLMFPDKDTRKVTEFSASDKLFTTLNDSAQWGIDMGIRTVGELNDVIASGRIQDMILVQESYMEQKIGDIAETLAADRRKKFVLIAGPSSSGKTTFSHRLSIQMTAHGLKPHPISLDDFYCNREETPLDENGEYDFECLEALDIALFNQCMTDLLAGKEVTLPVFNFKTGHREYRQKPLKMGSDDVLVIEGIHGLNEKLSYELPKENKYKIYISALTQLNIDDHNNLSTADGRLIRRMVRDARTRNTTARETLSRWSSVRRGEEKNIFPYQEEADVMFNSALIYELSVLKLYAEPLLFSIEPDCPEYPEAKRLLKFLDYFLPVPGENIGHDSILREFIGGSCFHV
ncbi:nucleoside kinase [uncultured Eubacterium sp.]|uniref:nucleoside kinase n=1 Tax=uncultured Eubacterium sp. TaxID=165185 RepID=UPI0025FAF055|nr:nucleoside kinase [uncultured Eubacterium sp.]